MSSRYPAALCSARPELKNTYIEEILQMYSLLSVSSLNHFYFFSRELIMNFEQPPSVRQC